MLFTYRYCRYLEEGSFRGRPADFLLMFIFGTTAMTVSWIKGVKVNTSIVRSPRSLCTWRSLVTR